MKFSYDNDADALTLSFRKEKVVKDQLVSDNIFAGYSKSGELVQLQILDISSSERMWLTVDMAAKILGKSERTILRWIQQGILPAKKVGKEYHISPESLDEIA